MKILAETANKNTVLCDAGEGQVFGNFFGAAINGDKISAGRYMVVYHPVVKGVRCELKQKFDNHCDAMQFFFFQKRHELFVEAKDAGLDDATAELIAEGKMTLETALGDMDCEAEAHYIEYSAYQNECEDDPEDDGFDPDLHGGEDDNTPSLEVIMAGGQAAWEWQNEKNAWLDSRI